MSDIVIAIVIIFLAIALCSTPSVKEGELATCTTKKLDNASFIVCTYKNKILYSGEVKDED